MIFSCSNNIKRIYKNYFSLVSGNHYILLTCMIFFTFTRCGEKNDILNSYPFPEGKVIFEFPPVDLSAVISFEPMGAPNVFPKDHGGFPLKNPYELPASHPLFAITDGVIVVAGLKC